jgi:membrane protein DedA with SNARE-associated domain
MVLESAISWLISTIGALGYLGIFFLMAIESSIIPVPAELVLIPAGYLAFQGQSSFIWILIIGTLGSLVGSLISYLVAFALGRKTIEALIDKYGKIAFLHKDNLVKSENYFKNHGHITIFTSRFIPAIRHLISLPAGFSKMPLAEFSFYTLAGAGIYNAFLIALGYFAGSNSAWIKSNMSLMTLIILVLIAVAIIIYVRINKKKK